MPEKTTNLPKIETVDFGTNDIYFFLFFVSVCVHASLCDFVCIALLLPFGLGFYLSVFLVLFFWCFFCFLGFFNIFIGV